MSSISRRRPVGPVGTHGTSMQVRWRWSDFCGDMKSHPAKRGAPEGSYRLQAVEAAVERVADHPVARRAPAGAPGTRWRAGLTAFGSRSMPGVSLAQS
jgi:hypothetical protein